MNMEVNDFFDTQIKDQQVEKKTLFINEMSVLPQQEKNKAL